MEFQNQVILSIGSNLGDRLNNCRNVVTQIHETIATVVQVSKVYETPAWGFEGLPFYNLNVMIHTYLDPESLFMALQKLELNFGRLKTKPNEYEDRIIDIDIIAFNDMVYSSDLLCIPHPRMNLRKFVLFPLLDIKPDYIHPIVKKSIQQLIDGCTDTSECLVIESIENPTKMYHFKEGNYVVIEGNIGVGKTSLTHRISEDFNGQLVLERFADNPFLPLFYEQPDRYAFSLEMAFLAERFHQVTNDVRQLNSESNFKIGDYHILKSLIFSKITLSENEFEVYKKWFDIIYHQIPKPDLYVYLYQHPNRLLQNIQKRGRSYEASITTTYLEQLHQGYLDFLESRPDLNVLIIDVSDLDFVEKQEDYLRTLSLIQQKKVTK